MWLSSLSFVSRSEWMLASPTLYICLLSPRTSSFHVVVFLFCFFLLTVITNNMCIEVEMITGITLFWLWVVKRPNIHVHISLIANYFETQPLAAWIQPINTKCFCKITRLLNRLLFSSCKFLWKLPDWSHRKTNSICYTSSQQPTKWFHSLSMNRDIFIELKLHVITLWYVLFKS